MMVLLRTVATGLLLWTAACIALAAEGPRNALVIGNGSYRDAPLQNPVNDARAVARALTASGFKVTLKENLDHRQMVQVVREFGDVLRRGGVGLFYFAGHGMQITGRNFLIPVNAQIEREDEVAFAALDAQAVLDKMESAGNGTNIVILDACRNNPFARSFRSKTQGLAQMDAPVGTLLAYATSPGSVASDGTGEHGLYTQHLLSALQQPGLKVEDVFKQVRANVRRNSQGKQVPWESTSLEGDFYFKPPTVAMAVPQPAPTAAITTPVSPAPLGRPAQSTRPSPSPAQVVAAYTPQLREPPSDENPQYRVGDEWSFRAVDLYRNEVTENYRRKVEQVLPNGDVVMNGGLYVTNARGDAKRDVSGRWRERQIPDSGSIWLPAELRVGHKQPVSYTVTGQRDDGNDLHEDYRGTLAVVARERITVPAGEFEAYKIERVLTFNGKWLNRPGEWSGNNRATGWYVPELRTFVAREITHRIGGGAPDRVRTELTSYQLVPR